jgi:hypothetical protein
MFKKAEKPTKAEFALSISAGRLFKTSGVFA